LFSTKQNVSPDAYTTAHNFVTAALNLCGEGYPGPMCKE
jgi:hypothetical protein